MKGKQKIKANLSIINKDPLVQGQDPFQGIIVMKIKKEVI